MLTFVDGGDGVDGRMMRIVKWMILGGRKRVYDRASGFACYMPGGYVLREIASDLGRRYGDTGVIGVGRVLMRITKTEMRRQR